MSIILVFQSSKIDPIETMKFFGSESWSKELPRASQAAFNSADKEHDPLCLQDTRVDVLNEIRAWANGEEERCIFWLNGMAGTGKSTIARTVAREFYSQGRLGASFFFSRGTEDRSHARKFFTTIAVQLANTSPSLKMHICTAITKQSNIASQSRRDQWKHLILQPLSQWTATLSQLPLIIVIDALDECDGDKDVRGILQLLIDEAKLLDNIKLRIFITSRPETPIRLGFGDMPDILHRDLALHKISRTIVDKDISIFLEHELEKIRNGWPGKEKISILVAKAQGLFIYAATVCRFIEKEADQWPLDRLLRIILSNETTDDIITDEPSTKDLDHIYSQILEHQLKDVKNPKKRERLESIFRQVVGAIVILFNPLSTVGIAKLLNIGEEMVQLRLCHLHSVLEVPDNLSHPLRPLHPSFRDFLLDKERCSNQGFWVDEKKTHAALADACIRLMSDKLRRDICELCLPGALASEVQDDRIKQRLPEDVQYACQFWVQHLQRSEPQLLDNGQVHGFLQKHLLHWLEALSLIRKTSEGVLLIILLEGLVKVSGLSILGRWQLTCSY